jgi:hypothetical protein
MAAGNGIYQGPSLFDTDDHYLDINYSVGIVNQTMERSGGLNELAPEAERTDDDRSAVSGDKVAATPRVARQLNGVYMEGFGDDVLFNNIYVEIADLTTDPNTHHGSSLDMGFITEALNYTVVVWNAYLSESKVFTALSETNPDGMTITTPSLPVSIPPGGEVQNPVVVDAVGPALQNTTYTFTVGGDDYTTTFTGMRVLAMIPEPDWHRGIRHGFNYETVMFQTERFREQRRSLVDLPIQSTMANYLMLTDEARNFFYLVSYGHDKVFGVPVYNELMIPTATGLPQGSATITIDTTQADPDDLWVLNNVAEYIIIVDHENNQAEIKQISSISSPTITVTQNITGDFDESTARVYPAYFATVKAITSRQATDNIDTVKLDFMEFENGG